MSVYRLGNLAKPNPKPKRPDVEFIYSDGEQNHTTTPGDAPDENEGWYPPEREDSANESSADESDEAGASEHANVSDAKKKRPAPEEPDEEEPGAGAEDGDRAEPQEGDEEQAPPENPQVLHGGRANASEGTNKPDEAHAKSETDNEDQDDEKEDEDEYDKYGIAAIGIANRTGRLLQSLLPSW